MAITTLITMMATINGFERIEFTGPFSLVHGERPSFSRFRVWSFGPSRNDEGWYQRVTTTGVPTDTRWYRSVMSAFNIRMQPYDTKPPTEPGMLVPWMAYSPPASVI